METLFKKSSSKVLEYSKVAYETAGLSANEYMDTITSFSASLLQSLNGDTAKAAEAGNRAVIDMSDNANKMGTSMESIQNAYQGFAKQNYTMLDNLKLGYGGTKEEMERLLADAQKISGQKYDLSSFADITQAIHVVQTEMGITGTTSKEAATTIQGSIGMMKGAWTNFMTGMADENQDFDQLFKNLIDSIVTVADNLVPRIAQTLPRIIDGVIQLVNKIATYIPDLIGKLLPPLINGATKLFDGIVQSLPQLISVLLRALPQLIDGVIQIVNGLITALPQIIGILVSALPGIIPQLINALVQLVMAIVGALPQILQVLFNTLPAVIESIVSALLDNLPTLLAGVVQLIVFVVQAIPQYHSLIWDAVKIIFVELVDHLSEWFAPVINWLSGIWNTIKKVVKTGFKLVGSIISAAFQIITLPFRFIWENCKDVVIGVFNKIKSVITTVMTAIKNFLSPILEGIKTVFSAVFNKIHEVTMNVWNKIKKFIHGALVVIGKYIINPMNEAKSKVTTIFNNIKDAMEKPISDAKDKIKTIVDTIKGFFSNLNLKFPDLKLPHFSITPSGWKISDLMEGEIPKLGIEWYAKAMNKPLMFTKPTITQTASGLKGFGDAGDEVVYGRKNLMNDIQTVVGAQNNDVVNAIMKIVDKMDNLKNNLFNVIVSALQEMKVDFDERELARVVRKYA